MKVPAARLRDARKQALVVLKAKAKRRDRDAPFACHLREGSDLRGIVGHAIREQYDAVTAGINRIERIRSRRI